MTTLPLVLHACQGHFLVVFVDRDQHSSHFNSGSKMRHAELLKEPRALIWCNLITPAVISGSKSRLLPPFAARFSKGGAQIFNLAKFSPDWEEARFDF
jgi:hypothetical protein